MTRADILAYLQDSLLALSAETGQVTTDTAAGYKLPIDAALRRIGATDLVTPTIPTIANEAVLALAEYAALRRYWFKVTPRIDTNTQQSFSVGRSQIFLHIKDLLAEAADRCALLGYPVVVGDLSSGFSTISLNLDYIEPLPEEWATP